MSPEKVVMIAFNDAHLCGDLQCRTISNAHDACPNCFSQTTTVARLIENEANALAHQIAFDSARAHIDRFTASIAETEISSGRTIEWRNLATEMNVDERFAVERAVQYLDARGALIRHELDPSMFRLEIGQ